MKWNPEITLGHCIQAFALLTAAVALWMNLDRRLTTLEVQWRYAESHIARIIETQNRLLSIDRNL
jgi:hypothetical protein